MINPHEVVLHLNPNANRNRSDNNIFPFKKSTRNAYSLQAFPHEVGNLHGPVPFRGVYEDVGVAADADRVVAELFKRVSDDAFSEVTVYEVEPWVLLHSRPQFENSCLKMAILQEEAHS